MANKKTAPEKTFTKQALLKSIRYRHKTDLIKALLDDGKTYTLKEVDNLIKKFLKGKVN